MITKKGVQFRECHFVWIARGEFSEHKNVSKGDLRRLLQRLGGVLNLEQFLVQEGTLECIGSWISKLGELHFLL